MPGVPPVAWNRIGFCAPDALILARRQIGSLHIGRMRADSVRHALREFTVLLIDGPGQGEALHRGIVNRHDWEVPVGAAIDYLLTLDSVDPRRIAVVGASMGGFYAARAAAFEPRLSACVAWGGAYDLGYGLQLPRAKDPKALEHGLKVFGAKDLEDGMAKIARYTLKGAADRIQCPTLIVTGEAEMAFMHPAGST